jgi:hypothetical protein
MVQKMRFASVKRYLWLTLICAGGAGLWAQNAPEPAAENNPPKQPAVKTEPAKRTAYVRTFSMGGSIAFGALAPMKAQTYTYQVEDAIDDTETGTIKSKGKFGAGPTFQFAFLEHLAINVSILRRTEQHWDYSKTLYEGEDLDSTTADDRTKTTEKHNTWARNYDVPILVRYYRKGHHEKGWRWFAEGGVTLRQTRDVRTTRYFTYYDPKWDTSSLDNITYATFENADRANKKNMAGFTAGAGLQWIDAFGIRVVPEVRYTHWSGSTWDINSITSKKNQAELVFTLTF